MKKYFNLIVALVVMLFAGQSFAYTPPPAPAQGWYIVDQTGKLSEAQKAELNQKIEQVSKSTKNEFGILLLSTMEGNNIEDVAYATFNAWGVGKRGLDNGCLIVVSLAERKTRIETGKGVGGEVTDLQAKQILDNNLKPFLKKGDFAGGFNSTLDALSSLIESRHKQVAAPASDNAVTSTPVSNTAPVSSPSAASCALAAAGVGATDDSGGGFGWLVVLLGVGGFVVWHLRASSKRRAEERVREAEEELAAFEEQQRQLAAKRREAERLERERVAREARPVVAPVVHYTPAPPAVRYTPTTPVARSVAKDVGIGVATGAAAAVTAEALAAADRKRRQEREENERRAEDSRRQRERDDEDRRRCQREDDDRRSSYSSSSSSSDYGFGGGSSSGGGFDGGSSGGGGASGDW